MKNEKSVSLQDFTLLTLIGKGSYAKVVLVRKKSNNQIYALKILKKSYISQKKQVNHTKTERNVLVDMNCPFIVKLAYAFQSEKKLFFVLEYCPGGELFNLLSIKRSFTEDQIRFYAAQIILALEYLHSKDIIYRDLKPENVLIDSDGYIKLTDFGLSKRNMNDHTKTYSICGTPEYLAPEILYQKGHGKQVDWWTLGSIMYEMLTGLPPFYTQDRNELFESIKYGTMKYPSNIRNTPLQSLLEGLFAKDPSARLGSKGVQDIKNHPWFHNFDWAKLINKKMVPPFKPQLKSDVDVSCFDTEFTELQINSNQESLFSQNDIDNANFEGFSYAKSLKCSLKQNANFNNATATTNLQSQQDANQNNIKPQKNTINITEGSMSMHGLGKDEGDDSSLDDDDFNMTGEQSDEDDDADDDAKMDIETVS